jgi:hypothetical protein
MVKDEEIVQERTADKKRGSFDYDFLLMRCADKCRLAGSVEFRGGYTQDRTIMVNGSVMTEQVYVPDSKQVFIESVNTFDTFMIPKHDEEYEQKIKKLLKDEGGIKKKFEESSESSEDKLMEYYSDMVKIKKEQLRELMLLCARVGLTGLASVEEIIDPMVDYE